MAERKVRIGVVSLEHVHAPGLIGAFQKHPRAEVVAIAHENLDEAQRISEQFQIPRVYLSLETMLDKESLDAVLCCAANSKHASIAELVLAKGLPMMVEKPMSTTVDEARRMLLAVQKSDAILMVNYPSTWNPSMHKVKQLIDDGAIGQTVYFRWRAGHRGPLASLPPEQQAKSWWHQRLLGGGALLDFCCYGANISLWWFGQMPLSVIGVADKLAKPFGDAEDNAVIVARYPNAFAVLEASWSQGGSAPRSLIVVGTEGSLTIAQHEGQHGVLLARNGKEEFESSDPLPEHFQSGVDHFLSALLEGTPLHQTVSPEFNLGVQAILEAGMIAAKTGTAINPRLL
ncbi:MAG: Gfo/Idh/MocA family oxidoreductase [Armatimonadetes bacterium]|nr:Gfo/Idh/MocA family oxidoreductase [Armatimonadota bacterium]MDW8027499.1 Gfo/Idh/MocA family oxidoreductase [Armatimonadota bacterium]